MNAKEKALLIFLILALGSAVVLNLSKRWRMSKEVLKILPLEEEVLAKENRDTQEFITEREEKVDINKAPLKELVSLPGIGPVLAERIIEYRERHKGFKRKEEIMKVKGIGRKKYERIRDKIKVE
ncbi:MAG: helix-hairpin-helix domain-containing protein [candidate division WOR-3 bacterium]